jgi:hypothetical protein
MTALVPDVKDYGAIGNGTTDDTTAIQAMITALGYAHFTPGIYKCGTTASFIAPLTFDFGAALTVPTTKILTISGVIDSPRQFIFQGAGTYSLKHDTTTGVGEDTRQVHASWFGAFPNSNAGADQAPFINTAFASMGNTRESIVDFDIGNYNISSQITVTRGGWVRGSGARRTVFKLDTDSFDVFITNEVACKFTDFHFENHGALSRNNAYIKIAHSDCELQNLEIRGLSKQGIVIAAGANRTRINNIQATYAAAPAAGSSVIEVNAGNITINTVVAESSSFGPEAIVRIGTAATGNISNILVTNVSSALPCVSVLVETSGGNIDGTLIEDIRYSGFAGGAPSSIIKVVNTTRNVTDLIIDRVFINGYPSCGLSFNQTGNGNMRDVSVNNCIVSGSTGTGIEFVASSGSMSEFFIGSNVDVGQRATPYSYSGTNMSDFKVNPMALPNVQPSYCYFFSIANDSVAIVDLHKSVFTGILMVTAATSNYATYVVRAAPTPAGNTINTSANMATATTALTGTTGTVGKFTTGITDGKLYFENRLGSTQTVSVTLMTGVA